MENQNDNIKRELIVELRKKLSNFRSHELPQETINKLMKIHRETRGRLFRYPGISVKPETTVQELREALELVKTHEMTSGSSAAADRSGAGAAAAATGSGSGSKYSSLLKPTLGTIGGIKTLGRSFTRGLGSLVHSGIKRSSSTPVKEGGNRLNNSKKNKKKFRNKGSEKRKKRSKKKQNKKSRRK